MTAIARWIDERYPRPSIDPDWLRECSTWISSSYSLSPTSNTDFPDFTSHVASQFLQSSLTDSTLPNTGLPPDIHNIKRARLSGPPCLVEIRAISDIAHSAFSLMNVRQNRMDRADLAGLTEEADADAEDEGPVPKYPRGMLRLELSDGFTTVEAVEYRSIPQLELGVTPLGFKILLKDVQIRRGILFLEPKTIELKGHQTEDHELMQDEIFLRSLNRRLGKPDPITEPQPVEDAHAPQRPLDQPRPADRLPAQPPERSTSANAKSTAVKSKSASTPASRAGSALGAPHPSSIPASTSTLFSVSNPQDNPSAPLARARIFSPVPCGITWTDDEEFETLVTGAGSALASPPKSIPKLTSKRNIPSAKRAVSSSEAPRPPSPSSDYDMDMDMDMDDEILAQVEKIEADALAAVCKPTGGEVSGADTPSDTHPLLTQGGPSARPKASTGALQMTSNASQATTSTTTRTTTGTMSSQRTEPGPSLTTRRHSPLQSTSNEDVILIGCEDDMYVNDSDEGKENIPFSAQRWMMDNEDVEVIDISD